MRICDEDIKRCAHRLTSEVISTPAVSRAQEPERGRSGATVVFVKGTWPARRSAPPQVAMGRGVSPWRSGSSTACADRPSAPPAPPDQRPAGARRTRCTRESTGPPRGSASTKWPARAHGLPQSSDGRGGCRDPGAGGPPRPGRPVGGDAAGPPPASRAGAGGHRRGHSPGRGGAAPPVPATPDAPAAAVSADLRLDGRSRPGCRWRGGFHTHESQDT
jgi:hypothetical protein